jgi:hypothetical protein
VNGGMGTRIPTLSKVIVGNRIPELGGGKTGNGVEISTSAAASIGVLVTWDGFSIVKSSRSFCRRSVF